MGITETLRVGANLTEKEYNFALKHKGERTWKEVILGVDAGVVVDDKVRKRGRLSRWKLESLKRGESEYDYEEKIKTKVNDVVFREEEDD